MKKDFGLGEDLGLKMEGKRPIEREHPREGQSRWYYIDPRNREEDFTMLTEIKTVDVPTKHTPNPALQEEMFADAEKNPDNYYIWRTVGDDKVRETHAERDGCIFSWDDAPEGGHPGEDYNCRCTAEPFKPEMHRRETDAQWREKLLNAAMNRLRKEENIKKHIYLDTKGVKTVGIGTNIDRWEDFDKIHWQVDGKPATEKEKQKGFNKYETLKTTGFFGKNFGAELFKNKSNLRISQEETEHLMVQHLKKDLAMLEKYVPEFRNFPFELQEVLLDIRYNTGNAGRNKWPKLYKAIDQQNIQDMAQQVHRKDVGEERNQWAKEKILSIKNWN